MAILTFFSLLCINNIYIYFYKEKCNTIKYDEIIFKKVSTGCQILFFNGYIIF